MEPRRNAIKNIISTTAVTSTNAGTQQGRTPGRTLPNQLIQNFMQELSVVAAVDPLTSTQLNATIGTYVSPIVDTAGFVAQAQDISVAGSITISGSAN